jgi:dTDP-4-dehydrorhamnose reductase
LNTNESKILLNILITGGKGQLGLVFSSLQKKFNNFIFFTPGKNELNISDYDSLNNFSIKNKIDVIVNCAGYTDVNNAEIDFQSVNEINNNAVISLVKVVEKHNLKFVHMSTDYVFDGESEKPYDENSVVNPLNKYGVSKSLGEGVILNMAPKNSVIIRSSWIYSEYRLNFVKTILNISGNKNEISVVSDEIGSPTNAYDLVKAILLIIPLIRNNIPEIYHYANKGECSRYLLAKEIIKLSSNICKVKPISSFDLEVKVRRPKYSVLNSSKIEETFNLVIPEWNISLKKHIKKQSINKGTLI